MADSDRGPSLCRSSVRVEPDSDLEAFGHVRGPSVRARPRDSPGQPGRARAGDGTFSILIQQSESMTRSSKRARIAAATPSTPLAERALSGRESDPAGGAAAAGPPPPPPAQGIEAPSSTRRPCAVPAPHPSRARAHVSLRLRHVPQQRRRVHQHAPRRPETARIASAAPACPAATASSSGVRPERSRRLTRPAQEGRERRWATMGM
jgi:hypothetical protein